MRHVQSFHDVDAGEIAYNREDIGHHTTLSLSEFDKTPSLITAIEMYQKSRQQNGKEINHDEYLQLIRQGEDVHVTERKQCYQPYDGQIEGSEEHAHHTGSQNHLFVSSHNFLHLSESCHRES